jgi:hypothetical protein
MISPFMGDGFTGLLSLLNIIPLVILRPSSVKIFSTPAFIKFSTGCGSLIDRILPSCKNLPSFLVAASQIPAIVPIIPFLVFPNPSNSMLEFIASSTALFWVRIIFLASCP